MWRLRREGLAAQRRRRRGRDLVQPDPATEAVERRVRAIAAVDTVHWVDATLRYASVALAEAGGGGVEGILCVRPASWAWSWSSIPRRRRSGASPRPTTGAPGRWTRTWSWPNWPTWPGARCWSGVVQRSSTPDGPVLVDLEQAGVLAVEGDPARVEGFLAGAALELASAPWASDTTVYLLGGDDRLAGRNLVEAVGDGQAFVADLDRLTTLVDDEDSAPPRPRWPPGWPRTTPRVGFPPVVVAHPGADAGVLAQLAERARPQRSGLALVGPGPLAGATWRLLLGPDGQAVLEPLGLELDARIDAEVVAALVGRIASRAEHVDIAPVVDLIPEADAAPARAPRSRSRRGGADRGRGVLPGTAEGRLGRRRRPRHRPGPGRPAGRGAVLPGRP